MTGTPPVAVGPCYADGDLFEGQIVALPAIGGDRLILISLLRLTFNFRLLNTLYTIAFRNFP